MLFGSASHAQEPGNNPNTTTETAAPRSDDSGYQDGFRLATGPDAFSLTLNGFMQTRFTWAKPDAGDSRQTFDLALARVSLAGGVFDERVSYFLQLEASTFGDSNRLSLLDGWMQYKLATSASVKAGRILLPYSRQFLTHPGNLLFTDLSAADYAFNLPRAIGVHVTGTHGRVAYDAAVANSVRALDAGGQQNPDDRVALMARTNVTVIGDYGYLESAPGRPTRQDLSIGAAVAYNPIAEASAFQNLMPGDRTTGLTVDAGYRNAWFSLQAAGYLRRNDTATGELTDSGAYVQGGAWIVPSRWEATARVASVDFDRQRPGLADGDTREVEVGLNRYLHAHHVKLQGDVARIRHDLFAGGTRDDYRVRVHFQLLF